MIRIGHEATCAPRIGVARLTKLSFDGIDLRPMWTGLIGKISNDAIGAGIGMDLSIIAQLLGDKKLGLAVQAEVLKHQKLFRSAGQSRTPCLRVLALAAATDVGGNTPVEFLLQGSNIELTTLYVVPGQKLPEIIPEHDLAMVTVCDSSETRATLAEIDRMVADWPRPVINLPRHLASLDRDVLYPLLKTVPGLVIPMTARVARPVVEAIASGSLKLRDVIEEAEFPLVVRPTDSHAGFGLEKLATGAELRAYLAARPEGEFFLQPYIDYAGGDGLYRKYRIVGIDGKPYACHMAISDQWKIWYLNADMTENAEKREEEARFMTTFEDAFVACHGGALTEMFVRMGLDYVTVDCAETKAGDLLVFEADAAAIVHDMDPPEIFPYKHPQMRKIFGAFADMLEARAARARAAA